jgi:site-specific recombinase XerD
LQRKKVKVEISKFVIALSSNSKHTERAYCQPLKWFEEFLSEKGLRIDQVNRSCIDEFINDRREHKGRTKGETLAPSTVNLYLTALSVYFEWRNSELDSRRPNPVQSVKRPQVRNKKPKPVDEVILMRLIDGIKDVRDLALILLFLFSGLRLSEVEQLNRQSISLRSHLLTDGSTEYFGVGKVIGKGNKEREFIVAPPAMLAIRNYLRQSRAGDDLLPLFLSSRKTRLSCRTMEQVLAKWCARLNLDHIHPHRLRHSYATRNIEAGMSLPVLAKLLGHESIAVTEGYVEISRARMQREYYAAMEHIRENPVAA